MLLKGDKAGFCKSAFALLQGKIPIHKHSPLSYSQNRGPRKTRSKCRSKRKSITIKIPTIGACDQRFDCQKTKKDTIDRKKARRRGS